MMSLPVSGSRGQVAPPIKPGTIVLGREMAQDNRIGEKVPYEWPLHMVLFGPNGVGKAMRVLVPNLLQITGKSIVVIDTKAQLAAMTAMQRHKLGDNVKVIDPFGVLADVVENDARDRYRYLREHGLYKSCGFNPVAALDPKSQTFYDDAKIISEALIKVATHDPHWGEAAQGLVTGLIMWERLSDNTGAAALGNVRRLLTQADDYDDKDKLVAGLRVTAKKMVAWGEGDDMPGGYEVASLAGRFASTKITDEIESIRSTAEAQTSWLLSRPMREDLNKHGIDFVTLKSGDRPTTVYVVIPAEYLETHGVWLRLVISEALRANMRHGGRPVLLMMDEFAALGHLAIVQNLFGVTRDYKVQMWPIFQDLPQLKQLYPDRWETILGNAGVVQSFRVGDLTTADWISKRSGQMEVLSTTTNQSENWNDDRPNRSTSTSQAPVARPTIYPHDLFGLRDGETITYWAGVRQPLKVFAPHLKKMPALDALALDNPYFDG